MEVQDGKGNVLKAESVLATVKQWFCVHNWVYVGGVCSCTKCLKTVKPNN